MRLLDLAVILVYLVAIATVGLRLSGRQDSATAYFVGERDLPWWAVCFSIVATETSTLTVISVPGVAYMGAFGFVELAIGYLIGRSLVAFVLLPLYMRGGFVSAYQYLHQRFGGTLQGIAAVTFLGTRLLAEGVRLFASAIPIKLLLDAIGLPTEYVTIIAVLSLITVLYTYVGGIRAVIWTDAIQMTLYIGGACVCVAVLLGEVGSAGLSQAYDAGKFQVLNFAAPVLTSPFNGVAAIVGGAIFSMASHGTDQLMVQRVLACKSLADGRRAMIGSACVVGVQFALFSLVGALLWVHLGGKTPAQLGLHSSDDLFPRFILDELPPGLSGLLIAGILSATMGSLSSALNSMANSTVADLWRAMGRGRDDAKGAAAVPPADLGLGGGDGRVRLPVHRHQGPGRPARARYRRLHLRRAARRLPARAHGAPGEPARRRRGLHRHAGRHDRRRAQLRAGRSPGMCRSASSSRCWLAACSR